MIRRRCSFKKYAWNVVSGKSPLIINNSERDRFRSFSVIGKSEQVTTTGKNLLDEGKIKNLSNYMKTDTTYYVYRLTGLSAGEKYTISRGNAKSGTNMMFGISVNQASYDSATFMIYDGLNETFNRKYITWTQETGDYVDILFSYKASSDQTTQEKLTELFQRILYVQLEKGSVVTAYEPYTGGKPSPSPEYPQEIKNVGKWNEEKQKYEVDVKVTGKNFFDKEYAKRKDAWKLPNGGYTYIPIYVGKGKRITISTSGNPKIGLNFYCAIARTTSETNNNVYTWIYHSTLENLIKTKATFYAIESDYIYFSLSNGVNNIEKFLSAFPDFQIEYGEERTDYEPYKEQTLTITSDRPITKWDKLVEQDGQIGWLYQSAIDNDVRPSRKDLFPYELSFYKDHGAGVYTYYGTNDKKEIGYQTSLCKQFKNVNGSYSTGGLFHYSDQPSLKTQYFSTDIPTVEEFKQWMENNPLTMLYKTKTPEFVPLQQSEQDSIRSLISYSPTTIITVDGGEVVPSVEVLCAIKEMM